MTQAQQILEHLQMYNGITSMESFQKYGITRLSARIYELRCDGHNIRSENITVPTRTGSSATIARYSLIKKPQMDMFNG